MNQTTHQSIDQQLESRSAQKIRTLFSDIPKSSHSIHITSALFLESNSDQGVYRNGGRKGARFGPEAILNVFKNMSLSPDGPHWLLYQSKVINQQTYQQSFERGQIESVKLISQSLQNFDTTKVFHLGGGHDHIYPLLKALENKSPKGLGIINIDAHLDTRTDSMPHSGTPFRQFANETQNEFQLLQVGIHPYANAPSNYEKLKKGEMKIIDINELEDEIENSPQEMTWILSLDVDGLHSSFMEAVSAVNHDGLSFNDLKRVCDIYINQLKSRGQQKQYFGIYEYNPIFDNLSQKGSRSICAFIYDCLKK